MTAVAYIFDNEHGLPTDLRPKVFQLQFQPILKLRPESVSKLYVFRQMLCTVPCQHKTLASRVELAGVETRVSPYCNHKEEEKPKKNKPGLPVNQKNSYNTFRGFISIAIYRLLGGEGEHVYLLVLCVNGSFDICDGSFCININCKVAPALLRTRYL